MSHIFLDFIGDKNARHPKHSSDFDNSVLLIHHKLSQTDSFRRRVRVQIFLLSYANFLRSLFYRLIGGLLLHEAKATQGTIAYGLLLTPKDAPKPCHHNFYPPGT